MGLRDFLERLVRRRRRRRRRRWRSIGGKVLWQLAGSKRRGM
jgi:hypothetical protein